MRLILTMVILGLSMSSSLYAQTNTTSDPAKSSSAVLSPEKKALILKFMEAFGTRKALSENLDMMIRQVPPEQASEAMQMRAKIKVDEILELLIPVYDHNFTSQELQGLITFYESPLGKSLMLKIPALMRESVEVSSKYLAGKFPEAPNPLAEQK